MAWREKFNLVQFAGENFGAWSFRIKSILRETEVIKAIEEIDFSRVATNATKEARAQAILISSVADTHLEYLKDKGNAYLTYKNLEDNFKKRGVRSRLFLRRKLSDIKHNEENSLLNHFVELEEIFSQLKDADNELSEELEEIFSQLKDADNELSEEEKINYVLLSMPKSYEAIVGGGGAIAWDGKENIEEEIISRNKPEIEDIEKREQRVKQKPKWQQDYVMEWRKAVEEEIKVLKESDTWEIVPKQKDMKLLDNKWVFTRKIVNDQSICKASCMEIQKTSADWARDYDRKSTTGYLFKVYNNTVVWKSRKQATVALSTTEAELVSLCEATVEACWIKKLLFELNIIMKCVTIFEDNQSTMKSVKNSDQKRLKHMDKTS
ncbi:hypothetical protein QE152_g22486 [Popillia japonica]|uniref:Polyprotein n=1 Tax=Popillia japonica TaxID=7064 RepID=A0AAW1KKF1_POPJA